MRKLLFTLAVMAFVIVPFGVNAASATIHEKKEERETPPCENDICTITSKLYITPDGDLEFTADTLWEGEVVGGRLVESFKIDEVSENFEIVYEGDVTGINTITLKAKEDTYTLSEEEYLMTVTHTYKDEEDKTTADCSVYIDMDPVKVSIDVDPENPDTGVSLPYIILGLAAVAGIGVYMVTKKNNKLFKI